MLSIPYIPSRTKTHLLVGAEGFTQKLYLHLIHRFNIPEDIAYHLASTYGTDATRIAVLQQTSRISPGYPYIEAEVIYAIRNEFAIKVTDILARRTRLAFLDYHAACVALPRVLEIMSVECGWSFEQQEDERRNALQFLSTMTN